MERQPQKLLPRPTSDGSYLGVDYELAAQPPKRRKTGVACDRCRLKRTGCNGDRPTCSRCMRLNFKCSYVTSSQSETPTEALRAEVARLRKELDAQTSFIGYLQSASDIEALDAIRQLKAEPGTSTLLASISQTPTVSMYRPSERRTARSILPPTATEIAFELMLSHAMVYPALKPLNISAYEIETSMGIKSYTPTPFSTTLPGMVDTWLITFKEMPSILRSSAARRLTPLAGPLEAPHYCDERLNDLQIGYWTKVPVDNMFAANVISMYLKNDQPILGLFDADLVLEDLVNHRLEFCSSFFVNALLFLACQSYACIDLRATALSQAFFYESERQWFAEKIPDTPVAVASLMLFGFGCLLSGKEQLSLESFNKVREMAKRMQLFGVAHDRIDVEKLRSMTEHERRHASHTAYGAYNWLSIHIMYFRKEPIKYPPVYPIPGDVKASAVSKDASAWPPPSLPSYMGVTFTHLCKLTIILQEILSVYLNSDGTHRTDQVPLAFAESKYQQLLAWADTLSSDMEQSDQPSAHVLYFHGLFHDIVVDLFRPFAKETQRLRSFTSPDSSPAKIFAASVAQLKRIVFLYMSQHHPTFHSPAFSTTVLAMNSALLRSTADPEWRFYFFLCMSWVQKIAVRYPIFASVFRGNLTMLVSKGMISTAEAFELTEELKRYVQHHTAIEKATTSCVLDFDLAMTASESDARADVLARKLDDLTMFEEFTTGNFDTE